LRDVRAIHLAVVLLLGASGVAGAAVTPGDYGGGAIGPPERPDHLIGRDTAWLWASALPNGNVVLVAELPMRCGRYGFFSKVVRPAADGTFRSTDRTRFGNRRVDRMTITGRFDGTSASGTLRASVTLRRGSGSVRRCRSPRIPWQMRMAAPPGPPAPPQAGATYHGLTSQRDKVQAHPFLLRVDDTGTALTTVFFTFIRDCRRPSYYMYNFSPRTKIAPDGTFSIRERSTLRRPGERERFRDQIDGHFTAGGVVGTFRIRSVIRRKGRVIDRCDTGPLTFSAVL
jgi:hypothetical protein